MNVSQLNMDHDRGDNSNHNEEEIKLCDFHSYCHFLASVLLILIGLAVTLVAFFGFSSDSVYIGGFSDSDEVGLIVFIMWIIGPIFINCGAIIVVKTIVYLRKKKLLRNSRRRRALMRTFIHNSREETIGNSCSSGTLPPTYDSVVHANSEEPPNFSTSLLNQTEQFIAANYDESSPPSYEDAIQRQHLQIGLLMEEEKSDICV